MRVREKVKRLRLLFSKEMWRRIFTIAKKEYVESFKNRWILLFAFAFLGISVLVSFYGTLGTQSKSWRDLQTTILYLSSYIEYMVPLLGLILGYNSIVGEKEAGSLELLLSYPVDRGEVLSGKFLGLWGVLATCVISGLGLGGVLIAVNVEKVIWAEYYFFILSSVIIGGVYLSLAILLSAVLTESSTSLIAAIFLFFLFSFIWLFSMYALAEVTFGWDILREGTPPRWYFGLQLFNPLIIWYTLIALEIPSLRQWAMEFGGREPQYNPYTTWIMVILLIIWIAVPLLLSEFIFKRREMG